MPSRTRRSTTSSCAGPRRAPTRRAPSPPSPPAPGVVNAGSPPGWKRSRAASRFAASHLARWRAPPSPRRWPRRPDGVIHHSGQESQYTSLAFGKRCWNAGVRPSAGSVGDCYDNAICESFFATLECELLGRRSFRCHAEARMAVFEFGEGFYNPRRRHSAIGYLSSVNYEGSLLPPLAQIHNRPRNWDNSSAGSNRLSVCLQSLFRHT